MAQGCGAAGARAPTPIEEAPMPSAQDVGKLIARGIGPFANAVAKPQAAGGVLRRMLELAIDGYGKLPGAKASAARQLQRSEGSVDKAIEALIDFHVRLASAQGFVTNLGGAAALPVAVPANLTGVAVVQRSEEHTSELQS